MAVTELEFATEERIFLNQSNLEDMATINYLFDIDIKRLKEKSRFKPQKNRYLLWISSHTELIKPKKVDLLIVNG